MPSSQSKVLKMSEGDTWAFVKLYEAEPVLWNTKHERYKSRDARYMALKRISDVMGTEGFGPQEVSTKFKNLRSSYCQELKKIADSKNTAHSYVPKVMWFSTMNSFLEPHVQKKPSSLEVYKNIRDEDEDSETGELSTVEEIEDYSVPGEATHKNSDQYTSSVILPQLTPINKRKLDQTKEIHLKRIRRTGLASSLSNAVDRLETVCRKTESIVSKNVDSFELFGRYIAAQLRALPSENACLLQMEITSLVMKEHIKNSDQWKN